MAADKNVKSTWELLLSLNASHCVTLRHIASHCVTLRHLSVTQCRHENKILFYDWQNRTNISRLWFDQSFLGTHRNCKIPKRAQEIFWEAYNSATLLSECVSFILNLCWVSKTTYITKIAESSPCVNFQVNRLVAIFSEGCAREGSSMFRLRLMAGRTTASQGFISLNFERLIVLQSKFAKNNLG